MYEYKAKCVKVIDGDTVDVEIDLGFKVKLEIRLRLANIDTPEMKTPEGKAVKEIVESELLGKTFTISTLKTKRDLEKSKDPYGRYIGTIILEDGTNYNETLAQRHLLKENSKWNTLNDFE